MRIIAGKHRSRKLFTIDGELTRPSSDRLKEALFSRLGGFLMAGCGWICLRVAVPSVLKLFQEVLKK
jgi:16S rRNA G966 N2-methylase RsmD